MKPFALPTKLEIAPATVIATVARLALALFAMGLLCTQAFAQSTAQPVVPGYLTTSGCPSGFTSCFVQFGSASSSGSATAANQVIEQGKLDNIISGLANGVGTPGSSFPAQAVGNLCRGATTDPTADTDGQGVASQCTKTGRIVTAPYAIPELQVRGMATATDNAAHSIIASAGGSLKNYITAVQCYNTSATTITVAFSDSATTSIIVPAGGGNNPVYPTPLATAAATAFTFTASTGETTIGCAAQGYTGL